MSSEKRMEGPGGFSIALIGGWRELEYDPADLPENSGPPPFGLSHPDFGGALQFSAYSKTSGASFADAAWAHEGDDADWREVVFGEFSGRENLPREPMPGARMWLLFARHLMLFVTYTSKRPHDPAEMRSVEAVLSTLKAPPERPRAGFVSRLFGR